MMTPDPSPVPVSMTTTCGWTFAATLASDERSTIGALPVVDTADWRPLLLCKEYPTQPPMPPAASASTSAAAPPAAQRRHGCALWPLSGEPGCTPSGCQA